MNWTGPLRGNVAFDSYFDCSAVKLWPLYPTLFPSSPEVGLGELLHVELLICEGGQVDVTDGGEHFTWNTQPPRRPVKNKTAVLAAIYNTWELNVLN